VENHARFVAIVLHSFLRDVDVCVVPSLAEARQRLAAESFDAVLLDYDLDDGKGSELVPVVLALPNRPRLIAASSNAEGNARLLQAGADAVCPKRDFARIESLLAK
jgi:CheY-like chemotaxis protein